MDKVLAIVGPTGVGKTKCSIALAKLFNGEIISADSMQVYRHMDIGTAKVTEEEKAGVPHYLVDVQDYSEPYNVKIFQERCRQAIQTIQAKGKLPIICGGTGLYLKAALYDYVFEDEPEDQAFTESLKAQSTENLYAQLKAIDPQSLEKIHPNNRKRIIRALQIAHNGLNKSQREAKQEHKPLYDVYFLGLTLDRDALHEKINARVDQMFADGLVQEVETLFTNPETWNYTSFQGIGYKEFKSYFLNEASLEQVKEKIKTNSRRYAKRQYTWFKNQMDVHWFTYTDAAIENEIKRWLEQ